MPINDVIEWSGEITAKKPFLQRRNSVTVGSGEIGSDIEMARKERAEKIRWRCLEDEMHRQMW